MGIITPPGMENFSWLFRILAMMMLAVFLYHNIGSRAEKDANDPLVVTLDKQSSATDNADPEPPISEKKDKTLSRRIAEGISTFTTSLQPETIEPDSDNNLTFSDGVNNWLNNKIKDVTNTPEGRKFMSAVTETALTKKTGIDDNTLSVAQLSNTIHAYDLTKGSGGQVGCESHVTFHMRILSHHHIEVLNTKDLGSPISTTLGEHQVLPGIEQAISGMHVGGIRSAAIPSMLAYENTGFSAPPSITTDQPINAVMTLLSAEPVISTERIPVMLLSQEASLDPKTYDLAILPVHCGTTIALTFKPLAEGAEAVSYQTDPFILGNQDIDVPMTLQLLFDKKRHGHRMKLRAKKDSPLATYINRILFSDKPQEQPEFSVVLSVIP